MDLRVAKISGKFGLLPLHKRLGRPTSIHIGKKNNMKKFIVNGASSGESGPGRMVDEDMLVLRKRMYEVRMEEINYIPPHHWMEWEKKWYPTYNSDVCSSLMWLQNILLNTRPGVTMATVLSISLSVPACLLLLLIQCSITLNGLNPQFLSFLSR
ncbi:uncharacterized protein LOC131073709 [Cryptomeria japonica]|uniref:uncharacterized protein LOC131073709 n=1 Tax=Cryptomeria japonica TaxID=3369 RepID=UPI0027D9CF1B|nr:uncharacterized protein LOC131073709 [Cryptomeria japonica]